MATNYNPGLLNVTNLTVTGTQAGAVSASNITSTNVYATNINGNNLIPYTSTGTVLGAGASITASSGGGFIVNSGASLNVKSGGNVTVAGSGNVQLIDASGAAPTNTFTNGTSNFLVNNLVANPNALTSSNVTGNINIGSNYVMKPSGHQTSTIGGPFVANNIATTVVTLNKQLNNIYTESSVEAGCECIAENLVLRPGSYGLNKDRANRGNRAQIMTETNDVYMRNGVAIQPGAFNKGSVGFDGGEYLSTIPLYDTEFKTQTFVDPSSNLPIKVTRQLIPLVSRPFYYNDSTFSTNNNRSSVNTSKLGQTLKGGCPNIFCLINDGMGYNQVWTAKVCGDFLNTYGNFISSDTSAYQFVNGVFTPGRYQYMTPNVNGGTDSSNFALSWEKASNYDSKYKYTPVASEIYRANDNNYKGITLDRSLQKDPFGQGMVLNVPGAYYYSDSGPTASGMSSGRLVPQNSINAVGDVSFDAQGYGRITGPDGASKTGTVTGLVYYQTLHEQAKMCGKITVCSSTSNILHATPAAFISKGIYRQTYATLIRNCFGPYGVNPNLLIGAIPAEGDDPSATLFDTSSNPSATYMYGGYKVWNFPEILSDVSGQYIDTATNKPIPAWTRAEYQLDSNGFAWASAVQYAKHYGYNVIDSYKDMRNYLDGSGVSTSILNKGNFLPASVNINSKVWLANPVGSTNAFILNNSNPGAGSWDNSLYNSGLVDHSGNKYGGGIGASAGAGNYPYYGNAFFKVSSTLTSRPVTDTSYNINQLNQVDMVAAGIKVLKNSGVYYGDSSGSYVWMHENSETDWGGHSGDFFGAGFETLEASKAVEQIFTDSSAVACTNILVGCDHECGGWSYGDGSGYIDFTDLQLSNGAIGNPVYYNALQQYHTRTGAHLASNFVGLDINVNLNGSTNLIFNPTVSFNSGGFSNTCDASGGAYVFDTSAFVYNAVDSSWNLTSLQQASIGIDTNYATVAAHVKYLYKKYLSIDPYKALKGQNYFNATVTNDTSFNNNSISNVYFKTVLDSSSLNTYRIFLTGYDLSGNNGPGNSTGKNNTPVLHAGNPQLIPTGASILNLKIHASLLCFMLNDSTFMSTYAGASLTVPQIDNVMACVLFNDYKNPPQGAPSGLYVVNMIGLYDDTPALIANSCLQPQSADNIFGGIVGNSGVFASLAGNYGFLNYTYTFNKTAIFASSGSGGATAIPTHPSVLQGLATDSSGICYIKHAQAISYSAKSAPTLSISSTPNPQGSTFYPTASVNYPTAANIANTSNARVWATQISGIGSYVHSSSICRWWQKCPTLTTSFADLGIAPWGGLSSTDTPAKWLYQNPANPRDISSVTVRQLLDLTI